MGYSPKPRDPRRLHLSNRVSAGYDEAGLLQVTVTYRYDEWCCDGPHEVADAIQGIEDVLIEAQDRRDRADREELARDLGLDLI